MSRAGDHLVIRADASLAIGVGHAMRCLALAQAWIDSGGRATFVVAELPLSLEQRFRHDGIDVIHLSAAADEVAQISSLARERGAAWVVLDGYHLDVAMPETVRAAGLRVLSLDDTGGADRYSADLVLNQNIHACEALYPRVAPHTRLLLGTHYSMLRSEFKPWRDWSRELPPKGQRLLVTMGGSDPENVTTRVLETLQPFSNTNGVVVTGAANPHVAQVQALVQRMGGWQLVQDASNMPELMSQADLAIAASGSTSWELAFMGLPAILLALAENQRPLATGLATRGVGIAIEMVEELPGALEKLLPNIPARAEMSRRGRELIDGHGAERVVAAMKELSA